MIEVSQLVRSLIDADSRTFKVKLLHSGNEYSDIMSFRYSGCLPSETMSIGNAICFCIECSAHSIPVSVEGAEIEAFLVIEGAEDEPIALGQFKADKPTLQDGITNLVAYDAMGEAEKKTYVSTLEAGYSHTVQEYFADVCSVLGKDYVELPTDEGEIIIEEDKLSGYSCRNALAYLAGFIGKNCIVNRNGLFEMRGFTSIDYTLNADRIAEPEIGDSDSIIGFLACCIDSETTLQYGTGSTGVEFISPLMTQEQLDIIGEKICGETSNVRVFKSAKVNQILGDPLLEIGDIVALDYNGSYVIPITSLSFDFDGGLSAEIESFSLGEISSLSPEERLDFITKEVLKNISKVTQAAAEFSSAVSNALGLYETTVNTGSGDITYSHDRETLEKSSYIFCKTSEGFAFSTSWGGTHEKTVWQYGIDKNGNAILKMLYLYELTADIITAGTLKSKDGNTKFNLDEGFISTKQTTENGTIQTVIGNGLAKITQDFVPGEFVFVEPDNWDKMTLAEQIECRLTQLAEFIKNQLAGYHVENTASNTSSSLLADRVVFRQQDDNETYIFEFGLNGFEITLTDSETNESKKQYILTLISDETYKDCFCHFQNNETEWLNPPMVLGEEYRTMKRHNGKAVYTKFIDLGKLPSLNENGTCGIKKVATGTKIDTIVSFQGFAVNSGSRRYTMPFVTEDGSIGCRMTIEGRLEESSIVIRTYIAAIANYTGYAILEYTKNES